MENMIGREQYTPGPASGARIERGADQWTLIVVRDLRHPPAMVWEALTNPAHLREWAPFEVDGRLDTAGAVVKATWAATGAVTEARVTEADAPRLLEFQNMRWELEALGSGTRLTLWHRIPPRYITWGAAGWHICYDVLDRLLSGNPLGRIVGGHSTPFGWQRLVAEYAQQFGLESSSGAQGEPRP